MPDMGVASNAAALFPSPRVLGKTREGTQGEGNKAAALEATVMAVLTCLPAVLAAFAVLYP